MEVDMPTLDELDVICTYLDDVEKYNNCLYHHRSNKHKPKAIKAGAVIWMFKDGNPVNFNPIKQEEEVK